MATWTVNLISPSSTSPADDIGRLTDALTLLRNGFAGATTPSGDAADAYMRWADSGNGLMKFADSLGTSFIVAWRLDDGSRPDDQAIWSNASDPTKKAKVDLSGIATGHTRTLKVQDRDGTLADLDDVQKDLPVYDAAATNSGNDYSVTLSPAPAGLVDGMRVKFKAPAANTGAATLNVNGLGAVAITKSGTTALASGDIALDQVVEVSYDGTQFQLTSGAPAATSKLNRTTITATGAWSWTPTFTGYADITLQGAGGGGAGTDSSTHGGGGGGGGALLKVRIAVTAGVAVTGSVGAKGTGGAASSDGTDGGDTTCGSYTAGGGKKGTKSGVGGNGGTTSGYTGKTGGVASTGSVAAGAGVSSTCSQNPPQGILAAIPGASGGGGGNKGGSIDTYRNGADGGAAEAIAGGSAGSGPFSSTAGGGGGAASGFGPGGNGGSTDTGVGTNPTSPSAGSYGAGGGGGAKSGTANQAGTNGVDGAVIIEWVG